jgi:hypothetical protein
MLKTFAQDTNVVPGTGAFNGMEQITRFLQSSAVQATVVIQNVGANQINYDFQEFNGTAWVDLGIIGTIYQNALPTGTTGVVTVAINSSFPQVRLLANASGGSTIDITVMRLYNRASNGDFPLLSF